MSDPLGNFSSKTLVFALSIPLFFAAGHVFSAPDRTPSPTPSPTKTVQGTAVKKPSPTPTVQPKPKTFGWFFQNGCNCAKCQTYRQRRMESLNGPQKPYEP